MRNQLTNHVTNYTSYLGMNWTNVMGFLLMLVMTMQILSGVLLSVYYSSYYSIAFDSIWYIMYEVGNGIGSLIRMLHILGSMGVMSLIMGHWLRGYWLRLRSFIRVVFSWYSGMLLLVVVFIESFLGYILVWGKMSYWGVTVLINIITGMLAWLLEWFFWLSIPIIHFVDWWIALTTYLTSTSIDNLNIFSNAPYIRRSYIIDDSLDIAAISSKIVDSVAGFIWCSVFCITGRMFVLHFLLGFVIIGLMAFHIIGLHSFSGSNTLINSNSMSIPFFPIIVYKDLFVAILSLPIISLLFFFDFEAIVGNVDNFVKADSISTPNHILPEWYFLIYYCCLRCFSSKVIGVFMVIFFFALLL